MSIFNKFSQWQFSKDRLEFFSDAVFAIVVTLLVLELKVPRLPHDCTTQEIINSLRDIVPKFYSWVISFFFVMLIWLHHHQIFLMTTKSDYGMMWINIILLFFISFLPFPTALMGEYPHQPLNVTIWGVTVCLTTLVLNWLYYYNTHNYLSDTYDRNSVKKNVRLSLFAVPLIYLVAALLAWVSVYISYIIYLIVPFLYILPLDKEKKADSGTHH